MPKYRSSFALDLDDLCLIESTLREVAHSYEKASMTGDNEEKRQKARDLSNVLGKLHNQKIFYSQVNETGVPAA